MLTHCVFSYPLRRYRAQHIEIQSRRNVFERALIATAVVFGCLAQLHAQMGDSYNYEKGAYALVPLHWSEPERTLTIGERKGSYPGMPAQLTFHVVIAGAHHGVGEEPTTQPEKSVVYSGQSVTVRP